MTDTTSKTNEAAEASCDTPGCCGGVDRRDFVKILGLGGAIATGIGPLRTDAAPVEPLTREEETSLTQILRGSSWPLLKTYLPTHVARIAMPVGGIGTGTVSLGGRGDLRDWEIMNRSAKGFIPIKGDVAPFFVLFAQAGNDKPTVRILEGPLEAVEYEGSHGSKAPNDNLPRFRHCAFGTAYPLGQVALQDGDVPVDVRLEAFNPMIPGDSDASGLPVAVLRYELINKTNDTVQASVCGTLPNFIGMDGWETGRDWAGDINFVGAKGNRNHYRKGESLQGIFLNSEGVDSKHEDWGTMALATTAQDKVSHRTVWAAQAWGNAILDFWDDFSADGRIDVRDTPPDDMPMASLAVSVEIPPRESRSVTFLLIWHFPNRMTWTPKGGEHAEEDRIGNYYTTQFTDAWDAAEKIVGRLDELEKKTVEFVRAFCESDLPEVVKEAALFNACTLRSQTCFRTPDGRFYGWEGLCNHKGCCHGSCTHVWNYEQATAFLFGDLAMRMREVEFAQATDEKGLMSFRVHLPISRAQEFARAAADGQMGCLMKMYRDWQLSGDDEALRQLWPNVKKTLEFCWIQGGWDADKDGVMEGCQHNTMDVEYYGPNPQMGSWYLGALRAAEEMARHLGDTDFADTCKGLFEKGSIWMDSNLFNGEYYEQQIRPPKDKSEIAPFLLVGMGAKDVTNPDYQLGSGCLVDQLVGQYMAHICGLGYLHDEKNVKATLRGILKYCGRESLYDHFNTHRSFALGDEAVLLMADYPKDRPAVPFPYYTEVMTGFEYTAAVGMLYEGQMEEGLRCIQNIRDRYDGLKRNPFNEAECGHHYARAMASWAAVLALTGFHYSAVTKTMTFAAKPGKHFWSNGYAWGVCEVLPQNKDLRVELDVRSGKINVQKLVLNGFGQAEVSTEPIQAGEHVSVVVIRVTDSK